ncbi:MAG TPA: tRNA pseudouridine(55) synthase TruB [Ktedonobacterales bacterium]|nr:tRNA pseudouridine(55) synthase TruB [Ktedonobacterales bacterium]
MRTTHGAIAGYQRSQPAYPTGASVPIDGIFNIDKPVGMTSHDVVAQMRRLAGQKRIGHAGTLDPAASGVLPILLGQATRVAEYLSESGKAYRATIRFGIVTDTYDAEGQTVRESPVSLTRDAIAAVLPDFLGEQLQRPPIYSALKRGGQRLYALARAGEAVEVAPRPIHIGALQIVDWATPTLILDIVCGKGTYIRSLAFDLGERLGPGAHLAALVRTRSGPFTLASSITLDRLTQTFGDGSWRDYCFAPDEALLDWQAAILGEANEARIRHGQTLHAPTNTPAGQHPLLRAYSTDGRFLGILRRDKSGWQPHKVLMTHPDDEH